MDRFNHDLDISGEGDDTDDTDDLPLFGSFGSYSPQYKRHNSSLGQLNDMFNANDASGSGSPTPSLSGSYGSGNSSTNAIVKLQTPQLRKLDVRINFRNTFLLSIVFFIIKFCQNL